MFLGDEGYLQGESRLGDRRMPGIAHKINFCGGSNGSVCQNSMAGNGVLPYHSCDGSSVSTNGFWSKHRGDMSYNQLQKFWCELTIQARHKLMKIDKHTLFEHARKNMYCSRCNGLLLEGFLQIVMYGKSLQQDSLGGHYSGHTMENQKCGNLCSDNECQDAVIDPSLHPWGGLTTARDGMLTLLDCYLHSKSLKGLQNVFDSARAREKERKLLYPDACGGGGRGWISQGMTGYGRGHGTRETCALHTAKLSVETLVDFWSALGEETRRSLLRMKEDDFIERLMFRFDSKRFCRDCRRNVIREFKELKELKRMRKDPRCTSCFCAADSVFQYEVSHDTVQADWHQTFVDACGTYHHFEWAIGTGEGKSDILDYKNVGLSVRVRVNGLDLSGLSACYINLRAWKMDGRCNELCVKAHALRGQQCVHCKLAVGDGYVTISIGENIRRFFEHAEEAVEEEDDDSMDKDGNELDGECSRPQKHAKSPELAREFLLDAATVIFKEQVEKAFREGTARQNAHSIFVCLAMKLLEERVHVACKEIATLEKQMKLLEEEEKEKREEEARKERRRTKEREKKLRRKERLREKENKEKKCAESNGDDATLDTQNDAKPYVDETVDIGNTSNCAGETGEATPPPSPPDIQDDRFVMGCSSPKNKHHCEDILEGESGKTRDFNTSYNHYRYSCRNSRSREDTEQDLTSKWSNRRKGAALSESELTVAKNESRFHADGFESTRSISCSKRQLRTNHHSDYRARPESHMMRSTREPNYVNKFESSCDISRSYYRGKYTQVESSRENNGRFGIKTIYSNSPVTKQVWEPLDPQKKCVQSNSDSLVALKPKVETTESSGTAICSELTDILVETTESSGTANCSEFTDILVETNDKDNELGDSTRSGNETCGDTVNGLHSRETSGDCIKVEEAVDDESCYITRSSLRKVDSLLSSSSNSDSSCLSEGDSNTSSSNHQNLESSSTSDSEESSQTSEGRDMLHCLESRFSADDGVTTKREDAKSQEPASLSSLVAKRGIYCESGKANLGVESMVPGMMHNQNLQYPIYQVPIPTVGYYHQTPISWPANGPMSFHYPNHYLFANGFGYDLSTNAQLMHYGGGLQLQFQHLPPPPINNSMPVIQEANVVCRKDDADNTIETTASSTETATVADDGKLEKGSGDFSLFHFGGPVALSAGFKESEKPECDGIGNHPCNRKDSIEEYNLFAAASNGLKFSIF